MARPGPKGSPNEFKAVAITVASIEGNQSRVCRGLGIPKQTLSRWMHGINVDEEVVELKDDAREAWGNALEVLSWKLAQTLNDRVSDLSPEELKRINPKDIAIALGVIDDKKSKARGEATTIVGHQSDAKESLRKKLSKLNKNLTHGEAPALEGGTDDADPE